MKLVDAKVLIKEVASKKPDLSIYLVGSPGIGKSAIVKQVADELGLPLVDLRLTLLDPTDLRGLPNLTNDSEWVSWKRPEFLLKERYILFLDEINMAAPSVQAAAFQLLLDRACGPHKLHPETLVIAAGNPPAENSLARDLAIPLINRIVYLEVEANLDDWKTYMSERLHEDVLAYLNYRPEHFLRIPQDVSQPFPSPRSWDRVSQCLYTFTDFEIQRKLSVGLLGPIAHEFNTFRALKSQLPKVEDVINGKVHFKDLARDVAFFLLGILVKNTNTKNVQKVFKAVAEVPEFAVLFVKDLTALQPKMINHLLDIPEFSSFISEHQDAIIGR